MRQIENNNKCAGALSFHLAYFLLVVGGVGRGFLRPLLMAKEQPELTIYEVPTSELIPYAHNAKKHDLEQVDTILLRLKITDSTTL